MATPRHAVVLGVWVVVRAVRAGVGRVFATRRGKGFGGGGAGWICVRGRMRVSFFLAARRRRLPAGAGGPCGAVVV